VRGNSEQTGGASGAGLGLSISRRLAEMMSGAITVESERARGTRFTLWLRAPSSPAGQVPSPLDTTGRSRPLGRQVDEGEAVRPRI
jgi:hypothetical protein